MIRHALLSSLTAAAALLALTAEADAQVERVRFDDSAFSLGTLTPATGAMPRDLWERSERDEIADLLVTVPTSYDEPLLLELLRRVLLSPGEGPAEADNALAGAKLMAAARAGFYDDAASLAALVPGTSTEPALSQVIAYRELMDGDVDTACARGAGLRDGRADPFWIKLRYLCYVRAGEQSAAELTFNLLKRQDILTDDEERRFTRFARGNAIKVPEGDLSVFDWVMLTEGGTTIDDDFLTMASAGTMAAIARRDGLPEPVRMAALMRSLTNGTIASSEALGIVESLPTAPLAESVLMLETAPRGSLEQTEILGRALAEAGDSYEDFAARAALFAGDLAAATPTRNYAPHGDTLALAAMVNGQLDVAERWLLALADDASQPEGRARAEALASLLALKEPNTARRIAQYLGVALEPADPARLDVRALEPTVPLASLVKAGLGAAGAEGEAPAALVFLVATETEPDEGGVIYQTVADWARDEAGIDWIDRHAAFRAEVSAALAGALPVPQGPVTTGADGMGSDGGDDLSLPEDLDSGIY